MVPERHHIHHQDHNKENNSIDNLIAISINKHLSYHSSDIAIKEYERIKQNLIDNVIPKAKEWHKSELGKEWHKKQYGDIKDKLHAKVDRACTMCEKLHKTIRRNGNSFCSNSCKSAYRRNQGNDNIKAVCVNCGKEFNKNKYSTAKYCSTVCRNKKH